MFPKNTPEKSQKDEALYAPPFSRSCSDRDPAAVFQFNAGTVDAAYLIQPDDIRAMAPEKIFFVKLFLQRRKAVPAFQLKRPVPLRAELDLMLYHNT